MKRQGIGPKKTSTHFPFYHRNGTFSPDKALAVLELCQPKPSIDVSQLQLSVCSTCYVFCQEYQLEAFPSPDMVQQAAGIYSYFIPPGYNERFEPSVRQYNGRKAKLLS